jgi:hypothetical protein
MGIPGCCSFCIFVNDHLSKVKSPSMNNTNHCNSSSALLDIYYSIEILQMSKTKRFAETPKTYKTNLNTNKQPLDVLNFWKSSLSPLLFVFLTLFMNEQTTGTTLPARYPTSRPHRYNTNAIIILGISCTGNSRYTRLAGIR